MKGCAHHLTDEDIDRLQRAECHHQYEETARYSGKRIYHCIHCGKCREVGPTR